MSTFAMLVMIAVIAFLIAWVANGLVGLLSGERPRDTGSLWLDTLIKIFAFLELGWIGRILNYAGLDGLPRKVVLFIGMLCVLMFLARSCHEDRPDSIRSYPVKSP